MNRLAVLIDGNNFYKGCQLNFNRTDVDFRKLGLKLAKAVEGELLRIYYYNAHVSPKIDPLGYQRQQKFFDNLRATPFITLKLGHLVYHRIRSEHTISSQYFPTEKGIDVQIAVDMIRLGLLKASEGTILVSGDSDYIYAVRFAKDLGSNLFVASFPQGGSTELRNEGDGFIMMDYDFINECFIRPTPVYRREPYANVAQRPMNQPQRNYQNSSFQRYDPDLDLNTQEIIERPLEQNPQRPVGAGGDFEKNEKTDETGIVESNDSNQEDPSEVTS